MITRNVGINGLCRLDLAVSSLDALGAIHIKVLSTKNPVMPGLDDVFPEFPALVFDVVGRDLDAQVRNEPPHFPALVAFDKSVWWLNFCIIYITEWTFHKNLSSPPCSMGRNYIYRRESKI